MLRKDGAIGEGQKAVAVRLVPTRKPIVLDEQFKPCAAHVWIVRIISNRDDRVGGKRHDLFDPACVARGFLGSSPGSTGSGLSHHCLVWPWRPWFSNSWRSVPDYSYASGQRIALTWAYGQARTATFDRYEGCRRSSDQGLGRARPVTPPRGQGIRAASWLR